ncbi:hypothetical protein MUU47_22885 [Scandinavium sp. H11S7]|uniref:Uncharacterized protein n=1 Tax=Scandinavium hiltneri TaxID=2926519 RepID=A0ABT2E7Z9_9ENTR|nr:hypothetical protein [Scandinavium hiltneri]MCS2163922.1 hypothetical protein [Scandinavium hiltneri]
MHTPNNPPDTPPKSVTDLATIYTTLTPLTAYYPEAETGTLHAFDSYGIVLKDITGSAINSLSAELTPSGPATFQLAKSMVSMDFNDAWNIITQTVVLYNGAVSDINIPEIDNTLLPLFAEKILILQPVSESYFSCRLYFNYS